MPRVVIVGAGPAGVRAAETLDAHGIRATLVDEADRGGGQIYRRQPKNFTRGPSDLYGSEAAKATALHRAFDDLSGRIDYRPETLAWNVQDGVLHVVKDGLSREIPFDALILATGAIDRLIPVAGWTRPGVYSLGAAQIALKAQACAIGRRVVFMGTGPLLYLVACQYVKAGAEVAAVLDTSPASRRLRAVHHLLSRPLLALKGGRLIAFLRLRGVAIHSGVTPVSIGGEKDMVSEVSFRSGAGRLERIACDAVGIGYHLRPETQLADLAGCHFAFEPLTRLWLPELRADGRSSVAGVYVAGDGARVFGADAAEISGQLAAYAVLADLGRPVPAGKVRALRRSWRRMDRFRQGLALAFPWPHRLGAEIADDVLVCRCEAVTAGTLRRAARSLDAPEVNRAKAFSRLGMGRCQGRYCGQAGAEIVASARRVHVEEVGRLRGQAPVKPLWLGVEPSGDADVLP